jgi:hypothetical protein
VGIVVDHYGGCTLRYFYRVAKQASLLCFGGITLRNLTDIAGGEISRALVLLSTKPGFSLTNFRGPMKAKILVYAFPALVLTIAHLAEAQQPGKVLRIGFLASSAESSKSRLAAFQQGLRELGYVETKNIVIEPRYAAGQFEKLPELAAELVRLKVGVLVVVGAPPAHVAQKATTVIPIVMGNAADPVETGLVASLARPGGNITGLSDFNLGVVTKRLELLKEVPLVIPCGRIVEPS